MKCTDKPWQYGIQSPNPLSIGQRVYGASILVRTPPKLPEDLECLVVIWPSISSRYFYQTSLGYHPEWGWHISAGSTNPRLPCDLSCPPFRIGGEQFKPKPNTLYELGIRFVPQYNGIYTVYLYFIDWITGTLYNVFTLEDSSLPSTSAGGVLEAYTINEKEFRKLEGNNAFIIEKANLFITPWKQILWPNSYGYEARGGEFYNVPDSIWNKIQIKLIMPGSVYLGYEVGGRHYRHGERIW